jgi:hypothetical protein
MSIKGIILLYGVCLYLFPRRFRMEFGAEMQVVFSEALDGAAAQGRLSLGRTLLKELIHLPGAALLQHLKLKTDLDGWHGPPSRGEVLVALVIFILPISYILLNALPGVSAQLLGSFFVALFLAVFFAGLFKGLPRWSLPYLGLTLSFLSFLFVFQWVADLLAPTMLSKLGPLPQDESIWVMLQALWAGLLWLSLLAITAVALGILALLRRFHALLRCIRQDWTLASYILYYGATFTLFLAYEQYRDRGAFALASALCLACGAWIYLHGSGKWRRILALVSGMSLAMFATIFGRWPLDPGGDIAVWLLGFTPDSVRWPAVRWMVFDWGWALLVILAPAALGFFFKKRACDPNQL